MIWRPGQIAHFIWFRCFSCGNMIYDAFPTTRFSTEHAAAERLPMNYSQREPTLEPTPILQLRPTQMTIGRREVERKRKSWSERDPETLASYFESHMAPVILGPEGERYLIDHHHLVLALYEEGVKSLYVSVVCDLQKVDAGDFWNMMDYHGWTHPFDEKGRRRSYDDLPKTIEGMRDDPYRALAGALRFGGGFAKDSTPYSEFVWADFLRRHIDPKTLKSNFEAALAQARELATSSGADYLPGWCGGILKPRSPRSSKVRERPRMRRRPNVIKLPNPTRPRNHTRNSAAANWRHARDASRRR